MEWAIVAALLFWALRTESLPDVVGGVIGWLVLAGAAVALFWACVIFPVVAVALTTIGLAATSFYLLHRFSLNDERIQRTITKRRRELGYDD